MAEEYHSLWRGAKFRDIHFKMIFCKMCKHIATWMALLLVQLLPLTADAKKLQKTLDKEAKKLQARAGIQGEQQADLQLMAQVQNTCALN